MGDFDKFVKHLNNGDLDGVNRCFRPEFLEMPSDLQMRPIHLACADGNVDIVKFLIDLNCNIECEDDMRSRPIHQACSYGHVDIVKVLVDHNCNIECEDDLRLRPIHRACTHGHADIVKILIDHNCNIECENYRGWRPIHLACTHGHVDILRLLVDNRCELQCKNENGSTPLLLATRERHIGCKDLLIEALKMFFDCIRRNECQALEGLKTADVLLREEPETGLSFLEVAVQSKATKVIKYVLDKKVCNEEIPPLKFYIENSPRLPAVELIQQCLLYRSIRYQHVDGFKLSCLDNIVNGHRHIVSSSFLEIAAEYRASSFISEILRKSNYNKREWIKAKNLAILRDHQKIADAIYIKENEVPTKTPDKVPTNTPDKVLTETTDEVPTKNTDEVPTKNTDKVPTKTPDKVPTKTPDKVPTKTTDKVPTKTTDKDDPLLWCFVIDERRLSLDEVEARTSEDMIMISYCRQDDTIVRKIYEELIKRNYKIWIDFKNMGNDLKQSMALAVEQCKAIIVCASSNYQRSENCKKEMTYAQDCKKCLVPILVEKNFIPSEWLGFGLSGLNRVNMSGKYDFKTGISKLIDHLDGHVLNK